MTYAIPAGISPEKLLIVNPTFGVTVNVPDFCCALTVSVINARMRVNVFLSIQVMVVSKTLFIVFTVLFLVDFCRKDKMKRKYFQIIKELLVHQKYTVFVTSN